MIIGKKNLEKLYPVFKEDIAENGIDLRLGGVYRIHTEQTLKCGAVDDVKYKPDYVKLEPVDNEYQLMPGVFYFISIDRPISIPDGYCQDYRIRSTFARCGLSLSNGYGDNGFTGTLMFGLVNNGPVPVCIGENERIVQAVTYRNDGTCSDYTGVYQSDEFYKTR